MCCLHLHGAIQHLLLSIATTSTWTKFIHPDDQMLEQGIILLSIQIPSKQPLHLKSHKIILLCPDVLHCLSVGYLTLHIHFILSTWSWIHTCFSYFNFVFYVNSQHLISFLFSLKAEYILICCLNEPNLSHNTRNFITAAWIFFISLKTRKKTTSQRNFTFKCNVHLPTNALLLI